jgi:hypothetical protein
MNAKERALVVLLRVNAGVLLLALLAVFLPTEWMARTHRWLGLGAFPASPLVDYLTRSASALYAVHGGLVLILSLDIRRFAPVIEYVAWAGVVFGILIIGIDVTAGLPLSGSSRRARRCWCWGWSCSGSPGGYRSSRPPPGDSARPGSRSRRRSGKITEPSPSPGGDR